MAKTYYTYRICIANHENVKIEKTDPERQSLGQPSGSFRYQEKIAVAEPILEIARNNVENELNDAAKTRELGEALFEILFDDVLRQARANRIRGAGLQVETKRCNAGKACGVDERRTRSINGKKRTGIKLRHL